MTHEATNAGDQILNSHRHDSQLVEQREQQQHNGSPIHDIAGTENARTEAASKLLASILVFYKNTILSPIAQSYLPPLLKDLDAYVAALPSPGTHHLSKGATELEKLSASIALSPISTEGAIPLADYLFYAIVNLRRPLHSFQASIEFNARAIFNVVIASIVDGAPMHDCARLLTLCLYLKDNESCYPLRNLACAVCLELVCADSLPLFARTFVLRFILGPASMMIHHLETRIALSEKVLCLLMEDSCEDIEFTSLVRRIAKKIGIHKPTSNMEQLQSKLYHYLELVVMDPIQYSRRKNISAYMTKTEWKTTLDHDVVFHFYLIENRSQMLLFLEAIKAVGIEVSVYEPGQIQKAILGEQSLMDIALVQLYQVQKQLRLTVGRYRSVSSGEPEKTSDGFTATCILDMAFDLTVENLDPTSSIQTLLARASNDVCRLFRVPCKGQSLEESANQLLDMSRQLLKISAVAPIHFIPRILWMTAVCLRTCRELRQDGGSIDTQIRRSMACCLDIFLACLVHRNEPRFNFSRLPNIGKCEQHVCFIADLELALSIFTVLFPFHEATTWTIVLPHNFVQQQHPVMEPNIYAGFLFQFFGHLVPLLERLIHEDGASSCFLLAGVALDSLSHHVPAAVLVQGATDILRVLNDIADLQRDSILSSSPVWQAMFDPARVPHPLQELQSRLQVLQDSCPTINGV